MKMWLALPHPHWTSDVWEHPPKSEEPKCSTGLLLTLLTRLAFPTLYLSQTFSLRVWRWTLFIMQWDVLRLPMLLQLIPTDEHRHWEPCENGTDLWYSPASQTGERVLSQSSAWTACRQQEPAAAEGTALDPVLLCYVWGSVDPPGSSTPVGGRAWKGIKRLTWGPELSRQYPGCTPTPTISPKPHYPDISDMMLLFAWAYREAPVWLWNNRVRL